MAKGPVKTADQAAKNWASGMSSMTAQQKYTQGVSNFSGNPMALAASPDAQQRYAQNTARAVANGKMARKLQAADPGLWKANALKYGPQGLANASQKALPKYTRGISGLQSVWQQQRDAVSNMPKGGLAAAQARQNAALAIMMQHAGTA